MKKNLIIKLLALTITITSIASISAFAEGETQMPIENINAAQNDEFPEYTTSTGKITSVQNQDGYTTIEIQNNDIGYVFNSNESVVVIDQSDLSYKNLSDLKEGMEITAIIKGDSPTTMSIPPMTNGAVCFIINSDNKSMDYSKYDEELVNKENTLKLNIDESTVIVDLRGSRKRFVADDIKNSESLVFYTISTRSIPAQTVPEFVMIFSNEDMKNENTNSDADLTDLPEKTETQLNINNVELRKEAEALGYSIKWTSNDLPVIIEKNSIKAEITLGNQEVVINGEKVNIANAPTLENEKIVISSDFIDKLK